MASLCLIVNFGLLALPKMPWLMAVYPRADLLMHLLAFGSAATMAFALFGVRGLVALGLMSAGLAIELLQFLTPPRQPSISDMMANVMGIALAAAFVAGVQRAMMLERSLRYLPVSSRS